MNIKLHRPRPQKVNALFALLVEEDRREGRADLGTTELRIRKHLSPALGMLPAARLTSAHIEQYVSNRKQEAANTTINRELSTLRRAYQLAASEVPPLIERTPRIPTLQEGTPPQRILLDDQYRTLLGLVPDPLKPVLVVAYHLGLRKRELLILRRDSVDFSGARLLITGANDEATPRTGPIYGEMSASLDMALSRCEVRADQEDHLFVWEDGKPIRDFHKQWDLACQLAGIPGFRFTDLRGTATRNMIRAGFSSDVVTEVLGSKGVNTLWRYQGTETRDILEAGRRMQHYFDQQIEQKSEEPPSVKPN